MLERALAKRDEVWMSRVEALEGKVRVLEAAYQNALRVKEKASCIGSPALVPQEVVPVVRARPARKQTEPCSCCGGTTGVHRHRELQMFLDGKCRKQVETLKQGGTLTERRAMWTIALRNVMPNARASMMLSHIEGSLPGMHDDDVSNKRRKTGGLAEQNANSRGQHHGKNCQNDECTVCQDPLHSTDFTSQCELPCGHTFHNLCIIPWLRKKQTCPTCRENVQLQQASGVEHRRNSLTVDNHEFWVVSGPPIPMNDQSSPPCSADVHDGHSHSAGDVQLGQSQSTSAFDLVSNQCHSISQPDPLDETCSITLTEEFDFNEIPLLFPDEIVTRGPCTTDSSCCGWGHSCTTQTAMATGEEL